MGIGLEFGVFFSFQAWIGRCGQRDEVDLFLPFNFMEKLPFLSRVEFFGVGFGGGRGVVFPLLVFFLMDANV